MRDSSATITALMHAFLYYQCSWRLPRLNVAVRPGDFSYTTELSPLMVNRLHPPRTMRPGLVVVFLICFEQMSKVPLSNTTTWSRQSRRTDPISRSPHPF